MSDERSPSGLEVAVTWIAKLVAAGFLGVAAYLKFTGHDHDVELFERIGMEPEGRYLIGALEMLAAALLLVPQSAVYGALLGFGIMCGAILGHATNIGVHGVQFALLVFGCCGAVLYLRRRDAGFLRNLWDS